MTVIPPRVIAEGWEQSRVIQSGPVSVLLMTRKHDAERGVLKVVGEDAGPSTVAAVAREAVALADTHLGPAVSLPRLLQAGPGYSLQSYCPGIRRPPTHPLAADEVDRLTRALKALRTAAIPPSLQRPQPRPKAAFRRLAQKTALSLAPVFFSRREATGLLARTEKLLPALSQDEVLSHGDFTLTNLFFAGDGVVLTDLDGLGGERNGFFDAVHLCLHDTLRPEEWGWQTTLLSRVAGERVAELGSTDRARGQLESALFFLSLLRAYEALSWDRVEVGRPRDWFLRWLGTVPAEPPGGGHLPVRLEWVRRLASGKAAAAYLDRFLPRV